jgi:hypothetical protein
LLLPAGEPAGPLAAARETAPARRTIHAAASTRVKVERGRGDGVIGRPV